MGPVPSQCSVHHGYDMLTPQLGHLSALCPAPSVEACLTRTCDHRDLDVTCHQDLVQQELPVTGSA